MLRNISATIVLCCCGTLNLRGAGKLAVKFTKFERESLLRLNPGIHPCLSFFSLFLNPHRNPQKA